MKKTLITSLIATASLNLWGAGFQVLEQGASNMGTALAGATVNANGDASAAFWNPSAAFYFDGELKIDAAGNFIAPYFRLNNASTTNNTGSPYYNNANTGSGGNAGSLSFVPNMYTAWKFAEDWILTFSVTSPYGLSTEYDSDFIGSFQGLYSELFTIDINPSIAYKVFDGFSVSAGFSAQYLYANLTQDIPSGYGLNLPVGMKATSWGFGFNLGATYEYMENGRIGAAFRSEVKHDASGDMYIGGLNYTGGIESTMSMPATVNVGIYQRFWGAFEDFALMMDYQWTGWSCFDSLDIYADDPTYSSSTPENWRDTNRVSFGMHYYLNEDLTLRCGVAWDQCPIASAEDRTVRIPDTDRIWFSGGVGYKYHNFNFEFAYTYIMMDDSEIDSASNAYNGVSGYYTGSAHVISFQMGIVF